MPLDELNKYTFKQFLNLEGEEKALYKAFGLRLRPDPCCRPSDILDWQWGEIKQIQDIINKDLLHYTDMTEILCLASQSPEEKVMEIVWYKLFALYNFVVEGLKQINELEKQLSYEPTGKELGAGIEQYNDFGWFVTMDRLAGGDPLKYDEIGKLSYGVIFAKLKLNALDSDFNKRITKV
jgi:hypothetical protein